MTRDPRIDARAEQVQAEAAALPTLDQIRDLAEQAVARGGTPDMTLEDIRDLADQAVSGAEEVTVLLRRLSDLLGGRPEPGAGGDP